MIVYVVTLIVRVIDVTTVIVVLTVGLVRRRAVFGIFALVFALVFVPAGHGLFAVIWKRKKEVK